jgi:phosphatidylinositol glycan class A protein
MYFNERTGVRYLTNGMKVYHLPLAPFAMQDSFLTVYYLINILRKIIIREKIDIIHGH